MPVGAGPEGVARVYRLTSSTPAVGQPGDVPPALWVPGYDWEQPGVEPGSPQSAAELEADRHAIEAERDSKYGFSAWKERVLAKVTLRTALLLATPAGPATPSFDGRTYLTPMRALRQRGEKAPLSRLVATPSRSEAAVKGERSESQQRPKRACPRRPWTAEAERRLPRRQGSSPSGNEPRLKPCAFPVMGTSAT